MTANKGVITFWVWQAKVLGRSSPLTGTVWAPDADTACEAAYMGIEDGIVVKVMVHSTGVTSPDLDRLGNTEIIAFDID